MSWLGSATCRDMSKPRASRSGDSSSKSQRARRALHRRAGVGVDDLRGRHHRVGRGLPLHRDAVLDLGAHHAPYAHGRAYGVVTSQRCATWESRTADHDDDHDDQDHLHAATYWPVDSLGSPVWVSGRTTWCRGWPTGPRGHEIGDLRGEACAALSGRVLELGFGSGLNVRWYPPAVDVGRGRRALGRRLASSPSVAASRTDVPIERAASTGSGSTCRTTRTTPCSRRSASARSRTRRLALAEVRRVLRPTGCLHVLEHGLAPDDRVAAGSAGWSRATACRRRLPPDARRAAQLVRDAGFELTRLETSYLEGPGLVSRPWTYGYLGSPPRRSRLTARARHS